MRYSVRTLMIVTALIGIVVVTGNWAFRTCYYGIDDGYAQAGAFGMVVKHMEDNDGRWPRNWQALKPYYQQSGGGVGWSFAKYKSRIWIDFGADADELRRMSLNSDRATFRVIRATQSWGVYLGDDPNTRLWKYFRAEKKR